MGRYLDILVLCFLVALSGSQCFSSTEKDDHPAQPTLQESSPAPRLGSEIRKEALIKYLQSSDLCNVCKGAFVDKEAERLKQCGQRVETEIDEMLDGDASEAFHHEREAYHRWNAHQQMMADDVVLTLWDTFAGGTAGGSFYAIYLYDKENLNLADMESLRKSLRGNTVKASQMGCSFIEPFQYEYELFVWYVLPMISPESACKKVLQAISKDYSLFCEWMEKRGDLTRLLPKKAVASYTFITETIISEHATSYSSIFINQDHFVSTKERDLYFRIKMDENAENL